VLSGDSPHAHRNGSHPAAPCRSQGPVAEHPAPGVTKLDRLARSLRDATDIAEELTRRGVKLNLGGSTYDPTDPVGRLLFKVLGMVAEFESDLIRARTREGMSTAKVRGKLKGRKPKLSPAQERHLVALHRAGDHSIAELVELFGIGRATVYRALDRNPIHVSSDLTLPRPEDSEPAEIASSRG
jgi:DNA invertase Pin-like site-specific DNA recombinase